VGQLIDGLADDARRAKRYRVDANVRKLGYEQSFSLREQQCSQEKLVLEDLGVNAQSEITEAEKELKSIHEILTHGKIAKAQALEDRDSLKDVTSRALHFLEKEVCQVLEEKADNEKELYGVRRKIEEEKEENERLREELARCKAELYKTRPLQG